MSQVADGASSMLGGLFSRAADVTQRAKSAAWEKARDKAMAAAVAEMKPDFVQCPRCSAWVCRAQCWNAERGLCKGCAPDLGIDVGRAGRPLGRRGLGHAQMSAEDKKLTEGDWRETIVASCPSCGAPQEINAKFCPGCGADLKAGAFCAQCGAKLQPGAKFCQECGAHTA